MIRARRPISASDLLARSHLKDVWEHVQQVKNLTRIMRILLPKGTENFVRVASIRNNRVCLQASSAAIKMAVSYEHPNILSYLRSHGYAKVVGLDINIRPEFYHTLLTSNERHKPKYMSLSVSESTAEILGEVAKDASPGLKKRLESLAELAYKSRNAGMTPFLPEKRSGVFKVVTQ